MLKITYFVHGTTVDNERGIATGWLQGELSELGWQQVRELAKIVATDEYDLVVSSDLKRAKDTAQVVFGNNHLITRDA